MTRQEASLFFRVVSHRYQLHLIRAMEHWSGTTHLTLPALIVSITEGLQDWSTL